MRWWVFCGLLFVSLSQAQLIQGSFSYHNLKYLWPEYGLPSEERAFLSQRSIGEGLCFIPSGSETEIMALPVGRIGHPPIQWLLECNKPEKLFEQGQVYRQKSLEGASRLMLFHLNKTADVGYITLKEIGRAHV